MPQHGHSQLAKPRLDVPRGYDPNEPTKFQATEVPQSDAGIKSGQVISKSYVGGQYVWIVGGAAGVTPYMALQTQTDFDVRECGKLTGLSCAGEYVFGTGYYKEGGTYNDGDFLTYDAGTGDIKVAVATDVVIGKVSNGLRGPKDLQAAKEMSYAEDGNMVYFDALYTGLKLQA